MFNEQIEQLLALSKKEVLILNILKGETSMSIATLAKTAKIPRMTTYLTLNSLKNRGLITYNHQGKRKYWKALGQEKFSKIMGTDFYVIQNIENLWAIWKKATDNYKGDRIYGIQPTESLKEILKKSNLEDTIRPINKAITKNKLVVEGLVREDYIPTYLRYFENDKNKQRQILSDLKDRATDMVYVDNKYFNNPVDFMMFKDEAFLINWKTETAIEIRNKDMLNFLKELFDLARGYGKRVNQSEYLKGLLTDLN